MPHNLCSMEGFYSFNYPIFLKSDFHSWSLLFIIISVYCHNTRQVPDICYLIRRKVDDTNGFYRQHAGRQRQEFEIGNGARPG